jgi:hypothetical protein
LAGIFVFIPSLAGFRVQGPPLEDKEGKFSFAGACWKREPSYFNQQIPQKQLIDLWIFRCDPESAKNCNRPKLRSPAFMIAIYQLSLTD